MCEPIDPMSVSEGCAIDPPEASVTPPEKKDLPGPGDAKPLEDVHLPVDILLLTAKDCEFLSCLAFLDDGFFNVHHHDLGLLFLGKMGKNETKLKIAVIKCSAGAGGPDGAIIVVIDAVKILRPKAVFCVGFCGSLNRKKVKLGDVVLSARIKTYATIKRTACDIEDRNISVPLSRRLAKLIKSADYGWKAPLTEPGKLKVEVHKDGVFLSGPEVVDETERRERLINQFGSDAIAIEMEGEGVYAAARNLNVEWIVIKGVSDYADGKKSATDSWRPFASTMAASLTAHILSNPVVFKDWPHYGCDTTAPKRKISSSSRTGDSMEVNTGPSKKRKAIGDVAAPGVSDEGHDKDHDPTTAMRKKPMPSIPTPAAPAPLVLKVIARRIRKCAGCCKPLSTVIPGYHSEQDRTLCFGRFESYSYWNKANVSYKGATGTRHYHLNPVCTSMQDKAVKIDVGDVTPDDSLRALLVERFNFHLP